MNSFLKFLPLIFLCGCSTYRGIGEYQTASRYMSHRAPAAVEAPPLKQSPTLQTTTYYPTSKFQLYWPVSVIRVNRGFRPASDRAHSGVDLGGKRGTPIYAAHEGRVIYVGSEFSGYGNMIIVEYDREWATLYGHLDRFAVREGQIVQPGAIVGYMGSTGHATGVHLHFEVMHRRQPTDPLVLLTRPAHLASRMTTALKLVR